MAVGETNTADLSGPSLGAVRLQGQHLKRELAEGPPTCDGRRMRGVEGGCGFTERVLGDAADRVIEVESIDTELRAAGPGDGQRERFGARGREIIRPEQASEAFLGGGDVGRRQ